MLAQLQSRSRGNANRQGLTRLEKARLQIVLSIAEVCRRTGLSYDNYIKYEREQVKEQYMSLETLRKLSDVLEIDLMSEYHKFKQNSMQIVRGYMDKHKLSICKLAEICGVSTTTVKQWRNGTCSPSHSIWEKHFQ